MATRDLFNARTQTTEPAEFTVDDNNEIIATFADGGFIKFPAGLTQDEFDTLIQLHEEHNTGQVVITPEMEAAKAAERAASFALIGEKAPTATKIDVKSEDETPDETSTQEEPAEPAQPTE